MNIKAEQYKALYVYNKRMYELTGEASYVDAYLDAHNRMFQEIYKQDPDSFYVKVYTQ